MFVKKINLLNKKGYIKENLYFIMNLKERGITIGDLLIILIIIITSTIIIKSLNKETKTTFDYINEEKVTCKKTNYQKLI